MANHGKKRTNRPNIVFFDLECTGFDRPIRPVQVGSWLDRRRSLIIIPL